MDKAAILDQLSQLVSSLKGEPVSLGSDSSLQDDLEMDSVELMELIVGLEDHFQVEISDETIDQLDTVGDLIEVIKEQRM